MLCPLLHEELAYQDVAREAGDTFTELPNGRGVEITESLRNFLKDMILKWLIDVAHGGVVRAPGVDCQAVLLRQEVCEARHVWRLG